MPWHDHFNKPRRLPWPSKVAKHYYKLNNMIITLYQVSEWMLNDTVDIEFCENLQAVCHRILELNRQLWAAKGSARWGLYVWRSMVAIKEEIPKALEEYERACNITTGNGLVKQRCITRAFNSIAKVRAAIDEVNPPTELGSLVEIDTRTTAQIEAWLELWQLRRHENGDEEVP